MKVLFAALFSALALLVPSAAQAGFWLWPTYQGWDWLGPGTYGDPCIHYYPGSTCSGWNYWAYVSVDKQVGGRIHLGFQNNQAIRGKFLDGWANDLFTPCEAGWCGWYLKGGTTYWSGDSSYLSTQAAN
jgi:hypothetical protein